MNTEELERGKVYICSMAGKYGQTPATYLGVEIRNGMTLYDFYDGESRYACVDTAKQTLTGQMNIMHFTKKNVEDHILMPD